MTEVIYNIKSTNRQLPEKKEKEEKIKKCKTSIPKKIWIPILVVVIIGLLIAVGIVVYKKLQNKKIEEPNIPYLEQKIEFIKDSMIEVEDGIKTPELGPLKVEFSVNTKLKDLRKIRVKQISKEQIIENGHIEENLLYRDTYYHIIFFKEKNSTENQSKYFNKTYTGSIAIARECLSTEKEECEPRQLVDLIEQNNVNSRNTEEVNDLKDIPVVLCLFEITDNDVITSISCPKSVPKSKQDRMVLDLYFWKPPSIERPNKSKGNVKITIEQKEDNITVRDTDIGICSIESPFLSNCTTDFNLTTDFEGNVLEYNEYCFSNITQTENNYYIKNKFTELKDVTNDTNLNSEKYYETLNKFLPLLEPYMKYNQLFNFTQFKLLYNVCKNFTNEEKDRNLLEVQDGVINNKVDLFSYSHYDGTHYSINYKNNPGINTNYFELSNDFKAGKTDFNLIHSKEYSDFDTLLKKLSVLSKAGKKLASNLYENIPLEFDNITEIITNNITVLSKSIFYQDLIKFFDSSYSIDKLTSLPFEIVNCSDYLNNGLDNILNNIMNNEFKNHTENLKKNINNYIKKSHELLSQLEENLRSLTNALGSKKNGLTEIATYYLNNTPDSYSDIIIKVKDIFMDYYKNENKSIVTKIESLLDNFESKVRKSIQSQTEKLNILLPRLENRSLIIDTNNDEDSQKVVANIINANNYLSEIIQKIKEKVKKSMELKDNLYENYTVIIFYQIMK